MRETHRDREEDRKKETRRACEKKEVQRMHIAHCTGGGGDTY